MEISPERAFSILSSWSGSGASLDVICTVGADTTSELSADSWVIKSINPPEVIFSDQTGETTLTVAGGKALNFHWGDTRELPDSLKSLGQVLALTTDSMLTITFTDSSIVVIERRPLVTTP